MAGMEGYVGGAFGKLWKWGLSPRLLPPAVMALLPPTRLAPGSRPLSLVLTRFLNVGAPVDPLQRGRGSVRQPRPGCCVEQVDRPPP